ncbi:sulfate ABC transporter substrate-binding protein [soil metagenome]
MKIRWRAVLAVAAVGLMATTACSSSDDTSADGGSSEPSTINIVGFAVPEAANKAIAAEWNKTPEGENVDFVTSYGASGDQSRAVVDGLKADYVHFSVASDVTRLVDAGLVADDWDSGENKGIVSTSVVVFGVRKGNPLKIEDWDDLIKPGVEIVTPNPASSGAARWNALAAWGQVIADGGTDAQAEEYVTDLYSHVVSLPSSGRDATTAFTSGTGNVFLTYENEAILARQNGEDFEYIIPPTTLLIENPGAVLEDANPKATDWLDFVLSKDGQTQFALKGFRPLESAGVEVDEVEGATDPSDPYPAPEKLLTIQDDFVSWSDLSTKYFDEDNGIITKIIANSGKAS